MPHKNNTPKSFTITIKYVPIPIKYYLFQRNKISTKTMTTYHLMTSIWPTSDYGQTLKQYSHMYYLQPLRKH